MKGGGRATRGQCLALAMLGCAALGFGAATLGGGSGELAGPRLTDAAWVSQETGDFSATAGSVQSPETTCQGRNSAPNLLRLAPADSGLEATGYLVTVHVDGVVPAEWQSGTTSEGYEFLPANTTVELPASATAAVWGVNGGWNANYQGSISVQALGPGGWSSPEVSYDWEIAFDFVGGGYGTCTGG
ncbi:hypothetical protein [Glutamicibacter sp.]|uniref:hypothetical protein n=1 Tax=Glutamicibacter sp. TaxID=1931995 RepID=UPI003D6C498D